MARITHSARITGPVAYMSASGLPSHIPLGPCLVDLDGVGGDADIVWGDSGQNHAAVPPADLESAAIGGRLMLLD